MNDDVASDDADVPTSSVAAHPAARRSGAGEEPGPTTPTPPSDESVGTGDAGRSAPADPAPPTEVGSPQLMPGVLLDRGELCALIGLTESELDQLESFGVVVPRDGSSPPLYGEDAIEVARPACEFLRAGVDARHLRTWRTSAEREASLYEQLVTPKFRQRNPESHAEALSQLRRLDALGGDLRAAMTRQALRRHFES